MYYNINDSLKPSVDNRLDMVTVMHKAGQTIDCIGRGIYNLWVAISDSYHLEGVSKKNQQKPLKILGSS